MKNTSKKTIIVATAAAAVLGVGGMLAYFTDTDTAQNKFEVGKVKIDLTEPNWDSYPDDNSNGIPDQAEQIVPGNEITKDPTVTNVGKNDTYVFLKVSVPKSNIITANDDGTLTNSGSAKVTQLFSYVTDVNWELLNTDESADDVNTYIYGYKSILPVGEKTTALFDKVKFVNAIEGQGLEESIQKIDIETYAIQSDNTGTMQEAYTKYINQNNK